MRGKLPALAAVCLVSFTGKEACPGDLVPIPEGRLSREGGAEVALKAFALGEKEVSRAEWDTIRDWALRNGYDFGPGAGETLEHPVSCITWYDAIKFCNAASEKAGRKPAYRAGGTIYRHGGDVGISVDMFSNGYRLPTEAEWEYACRAGTSTSFYWGDEKFPWDDNPYAWHTEHQARGDAVSPRPGGLKKPNAFALYDMSGNVAEWCWDWYGAGFPKGESENPTGPKTGTWRVLRGGSVALDSRIQSGFRAFVSPEYSVFDLGLRVASSDPAAPGIVAEAHGSARLRLERGRDGWDTAESARRLFSVVNLSHAGLETAAICYARGDLQQALEAYRDYFYQSQRETPMVPEARNEDFGSRANPAEIAALMRLQGRIAWCTPLFDGEPAWQLELAVKDGRKLLKEWEVTGDVAFLKQWFHIAGELARHGKKDFDASDNHGRATLNPFNTPITWDWGMGFNDARLLLPELRKIVYATEDGKRIPAIDLANIVTFLATDAAGALLKDSRAAIPNQSISNARTLLDFAHKLPELRDATALYEEGARRFVAMAQSTAMEDGGDLEQSYNYNAALPHYVSSVMAMLDGQNEAWLKELRQAATGRLRMLAAVTPPVGGKPTSGSTYAFYPPEGLFQDPEKLAANRQMQMSGFARDLEDFPDPVVRSVAEALFGKGDEKPAFTSIAFPYSGYYVMRDEWKPQGAYLWFIASRPGQGHAVANINAFELMAYGKTLLTSGGASSYGNARFVEEDQRAFIRQIDAYRASSESRNTVLVDGKGQQRIPSKRYSRATPYSEPISRRWHTGDWFDLAEGFYGDGYGDGKEPPVQAEHVRQILYLRKAGIWLVTDRMKSTEPHRYTACWNFLPPFPTRIGMAAGFRESEVSIDEAGSRIYTSSVGQANMEIRQTSSGTLHYERFHGRLDPARGWIAPGIGGRRYPKTDIWSSWQGVAGVSQLISAIAVYPGEISTILSSTAISNNEGVEGLVLELRDGGRATWLSAAQGSVLRANGVKAKAVALLVFEEKEGALRGIVLQATEFAVNGASVALPSADFEFHIEKGKLLSIVPVKVPTGFRWVETEKGILPAYVGEDSPEE